MAENVTNLWLIAGGCFYAIKDVHIHHYLRHYLQHLGGGGGGSTKFYTGRLCPEVQPLTLLCTIFDRKVTPFVYLPVKNGNPSTYILKNTEFLF